MVNNTHSLDPMLTGPRAGRHDRGYSQATRASTGFLKSCFLLLLISLLFTGCASVPRDYPRTSSTAFEDYQDTSVGQLFEEAAVQHPGESGFAIIRYGHPAFTARIELTELAEKSLDLQYYIWEADATGRILAERLIRAADRGVRIRVLLDDINLAGRDAIIAAMDAHPDIEIREQLIRSGVELYEYRSDSRVSKTRAYRGESRAALHTKAIVFDRESVFIGSLNLDPRSFSINTEAGLYVESPELAGQVAAYLDEGVRPENSYRVLLDEEGELIWVIEIDGREVRYYQEPETTFGQRFMSGFIMLLPVEHQL